VKVHEDDFSIAIVTMKISYIEVALNLNSKPKRRFPKQEAMMAVEIVYCHYWLSLAIVKGSFLLHLNFVKFTFCVACRTIDGIMVF
jgi:hypothetical protein